MNCSYRIEQISQENAPYDYEWRSKYFNILNNDFLETNRESAEYVNVESYFESMESLPSKLDPRLIDITLEFIHQMSLSVEPSDFSVNEDQLEEIIGLRNVLGEQDYYVEGPPSDDSSLWFRCQAVCSDQVFGEVYAFWNPNDHPEWMVIQGISFSLPAGLALIFFPHLRSYLPRLNEILNPAVVDLAKQLKVSTILVYPLLRQGKILQQYYGYQPTSTLFYPSPYILGGDQNPVDLPPSLRLYKSV